MPAGHVTFFVRAGHPEEDESLRDSSSLRLITASQAWTCVVPFVGWI